MNEDLIPVKGEMEIKEPELIEIVIPQCCREGWDSCPHTPKRKEQKRKNIAL